MTAPGEYTLNFTVFWDAYFRELDQSVREKVLSKLEQLRGRHPSRHLQHGLPFFVEEVGQYRICFKVDEGEKVKIFFFVGDHKEYEKWYSGVK